ncbi:protein SRC2 homolog [Panicum virgatum]|uniref:C2 domain-containing protein n=1 Tax=Panicum virgatum TaxID=38727 RepID=A0A8T0RLN6_PANVG|nr:protein SRC2 homolog [Panicum virgatum]KAG2585798.1 hypothetical protein PVAP13_6KG413700 [Panicum virgatum]
MGSRYEVEVTVGSATNLKNVNWRNGDLHPYAVLWIDDGPKCSTRVDLDNGEDPVWDDKLLVPVPPSVTRLEDAVLCIDVVHADAAEGVKPLVGSARLPLRDVLDDAGIGGKVSRSLRLKRPSGRPQGRLEVRVAVREAAPRYYEPAPAAYGARDPYYAAPPAGYPAAYGGYGAAAAAAPPVPAPPVAYGAGSGDPCAAAAYGSAAPATKSKMGMGTGLAVGAAAGLLGGLALAEGASYLEDKFEDHVAEKVEEDLYADDDGGYDDDS